MPSRGKRGGARGGRGGRGGRPRVQHNHDTRLARRLLQARTTLEVVLDHVSRWPPPISCVLKMCGLCFAIIAIIIGTIYLIPQHKIEPWHQVACDLHKLLRTHNPRLAFRPIHETLYLDATSPPWNPQVRRGDLGFEGLNNMIFDNLRSVQEIAANKVNMKAGQHLEPEGDLGSLVRDTDEEWLHIIQAVADFLIDEHARNNYARVFVPVLVDRGWVDIGRWWAWWVAMPEEEAGNKREAMDQLCRWERT